MAGAIDGRDLNIGSGRTLGKVLLPGTDRGIRERPDRREDFRPRGVCTSGPWTAPTSARISDGRSDFDLVEADRS